jgi:ATP-dependent DNA helicase RecG
MHEADLLAKHLRLTRDHAQALERLGIRSLRDLLYHFPSRYEEAGGEANVANIVLGADVSLVGTLEKLETKRSWKRKIPISEGYLRDQSGRVKLMWFNQPYIAKMYMDGTTVKVTGKVTGSSGKLYIANPHLEKVSLDEAGLFASKENDEEKNLQIEPEQNYSEENGLEAHSALSAGAARGPFRRNGFAEKGSPASFRLFAVYPETKGISSLWFRHAIEKVLTQSLLETIEDPIPPEILKKYNLPRLSSALLWIHRPEELKQTVAARKRFAFEEIFYIQLGRAQERALQSHEKSFAIEASPQDIAAFMSSFPFKATTAQTNAINTILNDMRSGRPMSRLLEGDVGSGKTAVAATAAYATVRTKPQEQNFGTLQVAYMAPTEILAKQHFESFIKYFNPPAGGHPINIGLITGSGCYKFPSKINRGKATTISRSQLLKWVANGEIPILIGTHALIEKAVQFKHLALVVIDEQHRFGTNQRKKLAQKKGETHLPAGRQVPHLLSMTATPIPRTLALTVYGDLDLTLIDQMPVGRKPIITKIVKKEERAKAYSEIRTQLQAGRQAYVICPRIDEPDPDKAFALMAKSVKEEAKRLKKDVFPEYTIEILHSKMLPKDKDAVMARFANHEIDILVATSVVEVGVNVPNATVIFIEGAERFGLSQLHQLRGRVVRSNHQAYCYVCPESKGEQTAARLKALVTAKNGFELAEHDLLQRGPGELAGGRQSGISDIGMEALKNLKLVEAARSEAQAIIKEDEQLQKHPLLARELVARANNLHFE